MEFKTTKEDTKLTVAIEGRLDTLSAPDLEKGLEPELAGITDLVLDLKDLEYISSAGLRVILNADELMQEKDGIKLTGVNNDVRAILEMTGFFDILDIE